MRKPREPDVQAILRTPAAAAWQARLTASFFHADGRRQVLDEVRDQLAALAPGLSPAELQELLPQVLSRLIGAASRDASPPAPEGEPAPPPGHALEDRIITAYPYPVATPYRALTEQ